MPQVNRANVAANLNTTTAWVGGVVPTAADIAAWGTPNITAGTSQALGGSVSWQGIFLQAAQTNAINIAATAGATLTIGSSGIDMSSAGANFTISSLVALGSAQSWNVASGRTLTVSGVITGTAKNVTFSGAGTTVLQTGVNTSWTGSQLTVGSGHYLRALANRSLGGTTNTVEVQSGGALYVATLQSSTLTVNAFTVAGSGIAGQQAGAIFIATAGEFSTGKTITLKGASPVIGVQANSQAGTILDDGTLTGDVTFNVFGSNTVAATFTNTSTFTVPSGNRVILQGVNPVGAGVETAADFCFLATDLAGLGNAANPVTVKNTLRLTADSGSQLLSRDYFFEGESGSGLPSAPKTYSIAPKANSGTSMTFAGTVTGTAGYWVKASTSGGVSVHSLAFTGSLQGSWNLRSFSTAQTVYLDPLLDISGWTGDLWASRVSYGVAPAGAATYENGATIDNVSGSDLTLEHSGYTFVGSLTFTGSSPMSLGAGSITSSTSPTVTVSASTLTIPGNVSVAFNLVKSGSGTLALSGNNTIPTSMTLSAGTLVLNSAGAAGGTGTSFVFATTTELDSTTGAVLNQTGGINTGSGAGTWTWKGTSDLTFGSGDVTTGNDRTIAFASGGQNGTLKFSGAIATTTATSAWNFGGATAGAKQRVTLGGANASLTAGTAADQHSVTSGYFRIENANGLGAAGTTTTWWVGATNLGVPTTKAALELAGVTTPETKNVKLYNTGPNDDGALIGASGTSVFSGNIEVPNLLLGARIGVKASATLTLLGSGIYPNLNPANASTPLSFTAESGGTLNQNRILGANVGTIEVTGGTGTVVFSRANLHTGAMTCSAGTTKLTHENAAGAGAGNSATVSAGATMEVTVKAVFPATLTLGNSPTTPATFKVSV